jgi:large subunit ribosomal protein L21
MYALIKTGGKQYRVEEGQTLRVEKIDAEPGASVTLDRVLMIADGDHITVGAPYVQGSSVSATVQKQARARKVEIVKFRRRKHYRRQMGHRQYFTELQITGINSAQ